MTDTNEPGNDSEGNEKGAESNHEGKEIYFMILIKKEENLMNKSDKLNFISEIVPRIYYEKEIKIENNSSIESKVYKLNLKCEIPIVIEYEIGNDIYTISFSIENNSFIYDVELKKVNKFYSDIIKEEIDQNIIKLYNKLAIFKEAFEKNSEFNKIDRLYEEAIKLFKIKKDFNLLIFLFLSIFDLNGNKKHLYLKLLKSFNDVKSIQNIDIDNMLADQIENINKINLENDLIKNNGYDQTVSETEKISQQSESDLQKIIYLNFYGIKLLYLYYYDVKDKYFSININNLYQEKDKRKVLFDILIRFHSHFINPLKQNLEFYNNFIGHVIENKKEVKIFEKALKYIKDLETFLKVLDNHKNEIYENYKDIEPIKI